MANVNDDRREAMTEYVESQMVVLTGSGLLAAIGSTEAPWLSGGPTDRLRQDLLSSLERFETVHAQLADRVYPPTPAVVLEAMHALRTLVQGWTPPEISNDLREAAVTVVSTLAKAMFAPPPPNSPHQRSGADDLGLPIPREGIRTMYNASAETFLVTVEPVPIVGHLQGNRVFARRVTDARYRELVLPGERLAVQDAVVCAGAPLAYIHALRLTVDGHGADDGGLFSVALPDGMPHALPTPGGCGWIAKLIGASADGTTLHVAATREIAGDPSSCAIQYGLASVNTATGDIADIAPLPGIFA